MNIHIKTLLKPANPNIFIIKIARGVIKNKQAINFMILFYLIVMFVLYDAMQKTRDFDNMSSNNVRGDISRAGIIFLQGLQLRVLLECGYYSRAGIIIRIS